MRQMEADVVVVACGMSGLCAATQAQESLNATGGGTVVAFEKSGTVGGAANMGMARHRVPDAEGVHDQRLH